jgi:hypothetical protein
MLSMRSEHRDCEAAAIEVKAAAEVETTTAEDKAATTDSKATAADNETAATDSETAATVNEAATINGEQKAMAFASRFRCLASIRKEDEPPDWRSVQRGNAAGAAAADFKEEPAVDLRMEVAVVC